jgi:hypothetical protein
MVVRSQNRSRVEVSLVSNKQRISVTDLIAELRANGCAFADEDWLQHLRDEPALIPKSRHESRRGHTFLISEAERIRQIAIIVRDIGRGWDKAELAFCMAAIGMRHTPPVLVARHICRGIDLFFGALKRIADRSASSRRWFKESMDIAEAAAERASLLMFRDFKIPRSEQFESQRQQLASLLTVALGVLYFKRPLESYARQIKQICYTLQPDNGDQLFVTANDWLRRNINTLSLDPERNGLKPAIQRALHKDPQYIVRSAKDAAHFLYQLKRSFSNIDAVSVEPKKALEIILSRAMHGLPCVFAAISVERQLKNSADELLIGLRAGDDFGLHRQVARVAELTTKEFAKQMESAR